MVHKKGKRRTKEDVLKAGLALLTEHGEGALTIDTVCRRLGVTKGSFYHHFPSRTEFSRELLEYWEAEHTGRYIELCEKTGGTEDKYCTLDAMSMEIDDDAEVAVRAWALRDPLAREVQQRVDRVRMEYLCRLYRGLLADPKQAETFASLEYSLFIGSRQLMPRPDAEHIQKNIDLWIDLVRSRFKGEDHGES